MEGLKKILPIVIGIVVLLAVCGFGYYLLVYQSSDYYTRVDNMKVQTISSIDDMKYEYSLKAYNKNGNEKEVKFKTSRKLKDGAYLKLDYMILRGVKGWEEVQDNELPEKVKTSMNIK